MISKDIIGLAETADILGISKASVRNWIKHGYLQPLDNTNSFFYFSSVSKLKEEIQQGKIDRLKKRANKSKANKRFIPTEYIEDINNRQQVNRLVEYIVSNGLDVTTAIYVLALNCFKQKGDIKGTDLGTILSFPQDCFRRQNVYEELKAFYQRIQCKKEMDSYEVLFENILPLEKDILGIIYQSLIQEGQKANWGSYFTPAQMVQGMVDSNIQAQYRVLDPCCGTGQFLLAFAAHIENPEYIYGFDLDTTAVQIARINLLLHYPLEFKPQVFNLNTLQDIDYRQDGSIDNLNTALLDMGQFDFIATNPPWGAEIEKNVLAKLKQEFPQIHSQESFSFFLSAALFLLKEQGIISFVLPEAILNVNTHADIRKSILDSCCIKTIRCHGKRFKNVFSSVITMDLTQGQPGLADRFKVQTEAEQYKIRQSRFLNNRHYVFDVCLKDQDKAIIDKVYSHKHTTLQGQAEWALGIVTGNNKKYLANEFSEGLEAIYRGADIDHYQLTAPQAFIRFDPDRFQQVAPEYKYRAEEKLIYRFISNELVFAYDDRQSLTLNSANMVIPQIPEYPLKAILGFFNSALYQFIHKKRFNSIKILRGNLEQLPLPLWDAVTLQTIEDLVDQILSREEENDVQERLDSYILNQFNFTEEERIYIQNRKILSSSKQKARRNI